ncbi:MAG: Alkaline phosphatase synthesis transcriptional regulatory protein PhoP [Firmicutes bacterium]|nr:Alkaline phosphatase synthesis transcriptional regulatory protein PhoP [candidate division NPL-UPA2 bacterium]
MDFLRVSFAAAGYEVITAQDGPSALRVAMRERPDLIILNGVLSGTDRLEVVREVRRNTLVSHVPIMILSSRGVTQDIVAALDAGADDFIQTPFEPSELMARIKTQLRRSGQERSLNPLTGLPGNITIEAEFKRIVAARKPFAVIYADIDNFKSVNDAYGFLQGDEGIKLLAEIVLDSVHRFGNPYDFVGHVGGDDFVVCTTPDKADGICQHIIRRFSAQVPFLYHPLDRARGFIAGVNRQGQEVRHTVATISLAVVTNERREIESHWEIGEITAELKRASKQIPHSIYIKDLRGTGEAQDATLTDRHDFTSLPPAAFVTDDYVLRLVTPPVLKRHGLAVRVCDSLADAVNLAPAVLIVDTEALTAQREVVLAWIRGGRPIILLGDLLDDALHGLPAGIPVVRLAKPVNLSECAQHLACLYRLVLARTKAANLKAAAVGAEGHM